MGCARMPGCRPMALTVTRKEAESRSAMSGRRTAHAHRDARRDHADLHAAAEPGDLDGHLDDRLLDEGGQADADDDGQALLLEREAARRRHDRHGAEVAAAVRDEDRVRRRGARALKRLQRPDDDDGLRLDADRSDLEAGGGLAVNAGRDGHGAPEERLLHRDLDIDRGGRDLDLADDRAGAGAGLQRGRGRDRDGGAADVDAGDHGVDQLDELRDAADRDDGLGRDGLADVEAERRRVLDLDADRHLARDDGLEPDDDGLGLHGAHRDVVVAGADADGDLMHAGRQAGEVDGGDEVVGGGAGDVVLAAGDLDQGGRDAAGGGEVAGDVDGLHGEGEAQRLGDGDVLGVGDDEPDHEGEGGRGEEQAGVAAQADEAGARTRRRGPHVRASRGRPRCGGRGRCRRGAGRRGCFRGGAGRAGAGACRRRRWR